jgi:hypothetical protein
MFLVISVVYQFDDLCVVPDADLHHGSIGSNGRGNLKLEGGSQKLELNTVS